MRFGSILLLFLAGVVRADSVPPAAAPPRRVLRLEPTAGNPRNSEGDFVQLTDGRVLFIYTHFTGGEGDDARALLASRESRDGGLTWSSKDVVVVENEGGRNVMSVSLVRLRSGPIALFYLRKNSRSDCRPVVRFSRDEAKTWSAPTEVITNAVGYYVLNNDRVVQLAGGRIVVPLAQHARADGKWHGGEVLCYLSDDEGRSWRCGPQRLTASAEGQAVDLMEPGVIETETNQLFMLIRTRIGCQYVARSSDGGEHGTAPEPGPLLSPESPATITKILPISNKPPFPRRQNQKFLRFSPDSLPYFPLNWASDADNCEIRSAVSERVFTFSNLAAYSAGIRQAPRQELEGV